MVLGLTPITIKRERDWFLRIILSKSFGGRSTHFANKFLLTFKSIKSWWILKYEFPCIIKLNCCVFSILRTLAFWTWPWVRTAAPVPTWLFQVSEVVRVMGQLPRAEVPEICFLHLPKLLSLFKLHQPRCGLPDVVPRWIGPTLTLGFQALCTQKEFLF